MGQARKVRGRLIAVAVAVAVAVATATVLATAASAGAAASFDPQTRTGFISRDDVIAAVGKDGLVASSMVAYESVQDFTETCVYSDGSSVRASGSHWWFLLFHADARYLPGSGTITGYTLSPDEIVDGGTSQPEQDVHLCQQAAQAEGLSVAGEDPIARTYEYSPEVDTLFFNGVKLPVVTN